MTYFQFIQGLTICFLKSNQRNNEHRTNRTTLADLSYMLSLNPDGDSHYYSLILIFETLLPATTLSVISSYSTDGVILPYSTDGVISLFIEIIQVIPPLVWNNSHAFYQNANSCCVLKQPNTIHNHCCSYTITPTFTNTQHHQQAQNHAKSQENSLTQQTEPQKPHASEEAICNPDDCTKLCCVHVDYYIYL